MGKKEFWFWRVRPHDSRIPVRPKNRKGRITIALYALGITVLSLGGMWALVLGEEALCYLLFGLGAIYIVAGMFFIWAKTDPDPSHEISAKIRKHAKH